MDIEFKGQTSSSEFIDEAQNAVIGVVDNVSEMISETTHMSEFENTDHHYDVFYHNPTFWVGMAFVLVVIVLAKPVGKIVKNALTKRKENIIAKINEAEKLRDDAQKLLAQYERKFLHAKDEAQEILDKSTNEIKNLTDFELKKMDNDLSLKQKEVDVFIEATIEKTKKEINELACEKSVSIVKKYIAENSDKKQHEKFIDKSIKNILSSLK